MLLIKGFDATRGAQLGFIKIGGKGQERVSAKGYKYRMPVKFAGFLITSMVKDKTDNYTPHPLYSKMLENYGVQIGDNKFLRSFPVTFASDDIEEIVYTYKGVFTASETVCISKDGEIGFNYQKQENVACETCPMKKDCKLHGIVKVLLRHPENPQKVLTGGSFLFKTVSYNSLRAIVDSLVQLKKIHGKLTGIPAFMTWDETMVKRQTEQGTVMQTVPIVYFTSQLDIEDMQERHTEITVSDPLAHLADEDVDVDEVVEAVIDSGSSEFDDYLETKE